MRNAPLRLISWCGASLYALVLAGAVLACDNDTWPYVTGIEMYDEWTFSMV